MISFIRKRRVGGDKKTYIRKLLLVMFKIDRTVGGGIQKLFTLLTDPKHAHYVN